MRVPPPFPLPAWPLPGSPTPAPLRPAPGHFPPSAGLGPSTFPQSQIPRRAFSQAVTSRC